MAISNWRQSEVVQFIRRAGRALYRQSPERNFKRIGKALTARRQERQEPSTLAPHYIGLEELFNAGCVGDLVAFQLARQECNEITILGDKELLDSWQLASRCPGITLQIVNWDWNDAPPAAQGLVLVARIPMTDEHWKTVAKLQTAVGSRIAVITQLLLPFTQVTALMARVDYTVTSLNDLVDFYLGRELYGITPYEEAPAVSPFRELDRLLPLKGKRVIEFGPLEGAQTAAILKLGAAQVDCVEARGENAAKTMAAAQAFGWHGVKVIMDDFHNVSGRTYGRYDLVFAHGVYYHSISPFIFLENLISLSDHVFLGGFCATDDMPAGPWTVLRYEEDEYRAKIYQEPTIVSTAGINAFSYFFDKQDLQRFFCHKGFSLQVISDTPQSAVAGRYVRFLASREMADKTPKDRGLRWRVS
jgi:hypothetical protein